MPQRVPSAGPPRIAQPAVLLIDTQPHFLQAAGGASVWLLPRFEGLLAVAGCLRLPLVATFERPKENGWLPEELEGVWPAHGQRFVKQTFDCCREPQIAAALEGLGRRQLLVAGAETDVCVLQSVLSLLERGFQVFLLEDCVFSCERHTAPAIARMRAAGAVPCTLKTAFYELMGSVAVLDDPAAAGPGWAALLERLPEPEALPDWQPPS